MTIVVLVVIVLLALNALFVAAEFAIVGVSRPAMDRRAAAGNLTARKVSRILHEPVRQDRFIATAQLGITVASLGLGMYGEHHLAEWVYHQLEHFGWGSWAAAHALASTTAVAVLTYFHIVVGEMVPKSLALLHTERTVLWIAPMMLVIESILYPLVLALNSLGNLILRLVGVRREFGHNQYLDPEEIAFVVQESHAGGLLRAEAGEVIRELFDFGDLTAGEVMVPRVQLTGVPQSADAATVKALLAQSPHTRYPVYHGDLDHIVGVVHVKDLLRCSLAEQGLADEDVRPVPHVPATAALDVVLTQMRAAGVPVVVVMDEAGGTDGMVTVRDLFEEVVGDLEETGLNVEIERLADDSVRVLGTVRLEDAGDALDVALEHDDVDTVSGLVLSLLDRPPREGDVVEYDHVRFEVLDLAGLGVGHCRLTKLDSYPEPEPGS